MARGWRVRIDTRVPTQLHAAAAQGLRMAAEHVHGEAIQQTPIEEGTLRDSAQVAVDDKGLRAVVSFDTPYAVAQHEAVENRHPGGGNAKYLERPLASSCDVIQKIIATSMRRAMR